MYLQCVLSTVSCLPVTDCAPLSVYNFVSHPLLLFERELYFNTEIYLYLDLITWNLKQTFILKT